MSCGRGGGGGRKLMAKIFMQFLRPFFPSYQVQKIPSQERKTTRTSQDPRTARPKGILSETQLCFRDLFGVSRGNSRSQENIGNNLPELRSALHSWIFRTGKSQTYHPAWPGRYPDLLCRVFFETDRHDLLEFFSFILALSLSVPQQLRSGRSTVGRCAGPKWPTMAKTTILVNSEPDFGIREIKMDQNGPFWSEEVHFVPFRSANRTLAIPEQPSSKDSRSRTEHEPDHPDAPLLNGCQAEIGKTNQAQNSLSLSLSLYPLHLNAQNAEIAIAAI